VEEIIDAIKLNGSSIDWASGVITEFRETCPVVRSSGGRAATRARGAFLAIASKTAMSPFRSPTAMDVAREEWLEPFRKARRFADKENWKRCWRVPPEIRSFPTRPEAAAAARDFWMFYNRTREAKKAEFLKAGKDHRGKKVSSGRPGLPLISTRRRKSTTGSRPAGCIWRSTRSWSIWSLAGE
jgi:hypothetical protein